GVLGGGGMEAGWYADPHGETALLRWWDGGAWTKRTTGDPTGMPPAPSSGPPVGPPRGAPGLTRALIPTGSRLVVVAALALTASSLAQMAASVERLQTAYHHVGVLLEASSAPTDVSAFLLLIVALLLKAVRRSSVTGAQRVLRDTAWVGSGVLAALVVVACVVVLVDAALGGVLVTGGNQTATVVLDRVAVLVPSLVCLGLLTGEGLARFASNARIQLEEEQVDDA
nr:DUF2510 domain-containing protein [Actinomycetota bacterium]